LTTDKKTTTNEGEVKKTKTVPRKERVNEVSRGG
jgi:hypothetical protein